MKFFKRLFTILLIFVYILILCPTSVMATDDMNSTKQRTTGTYLPVLAQQKIEKIFESGQNGEVSLDDGGLTVEISKGTYKNKLRFSIRRVKWNKNTAVPSLKIDNEFFVGQDVFEITAIDDTNNQPVLKFDKPIVLTIRYLDEEINGYEENSIKMRYYNRLQEKWEEIPSSLDKQANSLTGQTDHLSLFSFTAAKPIKQGLIGNKLNLSFDFGGTVKNILLILGIIIVSGIGGWYVYKTYQQAKKEMELENNMSIAGGTNQSSGKESMEKMPISDSKTNTITENKAQEKDNENQIWIDF